MDAYTRIKSAIPRPVKRVISPALGYCRRFRDRIRFARQALEIPGDQIGSAQGMLRHLYGVQPRECPLCGYSGPFRAYGSPPRFDVACPGCGSHERHRLLGLYLKANPVSGEVIHLAPEPCVAPLLRENATRYRTADLFMPGCNLQLNLEAIDLPDQSVDVFICSHLLEHVDDRKALAELYRCTRPGGKVIIMVPIIEGWERTYENPEALRDAESRTLHFLQFDHVRLYGADLRDRIRAAGFELDEFQTSPQDGIRYGLLRGETVFIASRTLIQKLN